MAVTGSTSGFKVKSTDIATRLVSKDYLLDVYPNIASSAGARTSPGLRMWGYNNLGQLGNSTNTNNSSPIQVGLLATWKQVSSKNYSTMAIKTDGTLWAWGSGNRGVLGNGTNTNYSSPVQIGLLTDWKQVACGYDATLAIKTDGSMWAWGYSYYGQLGTGNTTDKRSSPVQLGSLTNWRQVDIQYQSFNVVAIKTDGTLWSWGYSGGQIGNGTGSGYSSPIQIGALTNWRQVSCGNSHTAATKTDSTLWAWGGGTVGQLGIGNTLSYSSPVQIGLLTNWKQVVCGSRHTAAVKTDGTLWTCGYNNYGQLGNGTVNVYYSSPIQIGALTTWKQISCGYDHTAAIKTDGTLWTWGRNISNIAGAGGQLGNSNILYYSSPIQIGSLTTWKSVMCGYFLTGGITDGYY